MVSTSRPNDYARPKTILIVDDNEGDVFLIQDALLRDNPTLALRRATDGVDALEQLRTCADQPETSMPDLVLLDLNMPRLDGRQVLQVLKEHPKLRGVPVVVLSSSRAPDDVRDSYQLRANCYIAKPNSLAEYDEFAKHVNEFWMRYVILPSY